jgi:hypothetical protein
LAISEATRKSLFSKEDVNKLLPFDPLAALSLTQHYKHSSSTLRLLLVLERYSDAVDVASEISEDSLANAVAAAPSDKQSSLWLRALHRRLAAGASLAEVLEASEQSRGILGIEELLPFLEDLDGSAVDTVQLLRRVSSEDRTTRESHAENLSRLGQRTQRKLAALKELREAHGTAWGGKKCAICGRSLSGPPGRSLVYGTVTICDTWLAFFSLTMCFPFLISETRTWALSTSVASSTLRDLLSSSLSHP